MQAIFFTPGSIAPNDSFIYMGIMVMGMSFFVLPLYWPMWGGMFLPARAGATEEEYYCRVRTYILHTLQYCLLCLSFLLYICEYLRRVMMQLLLCLLMGIPSLTAIVWSLLDVEFETGAGFQRGGAQAGHGQVGAQVCRRVQEQPRVAPLCQACCCS